MQVEQLSYNGSSPLRMGSGLNVVATHDEHTGRSLGDLVGHVIYGARLRVAGESFQEPPGYVDVTSQHGKFRLERHISRADRGTFTEPRLTVAPLDGGQAHPDTARQLLAGMTAEIAARLFVLNTTGGEQLDWLLSEDLASELCRLDRDYSPRTSNHSAGRREANYQLLARRDELASQIETLLSEKRIASQALEKTLRELDLDCQAAERTLQERHRELDRVASELGELETQLRYNELAQFVSRETDDAHHADQQPELAELDDEIGRWRRSLAELEAREADVRRELSQLHPDEASPLLPLADQRAAVAISQRLVADLNSEVARFARASDAQLENGANQSRKCLCRQSHARLHPLVDTLGQQVDKLGGLIAQYEAAIRIEQIKSEAQHLSRSQTELRATIDHLLDRRQSRLRSSRSRSNYVEGAALPADYNATHAALERRRSELDEAVRNGESRVAQLRTRREQLLEDRAALLRDSGLATLRKQLDEVTGEIELGIQPAAQSRRQPTRWRASDILAQLTDGRLRELRLMRGGRRAAVVDRHGALHQQEQLNALDSRLMVISLQLAAVAGAAEWGATLPLVVVDPFSELPATEASILALVLYDFARSGHQVTVVTSNQVVIDRWKGVGQPVQYLSASDELHPPLKPRLAEKTLNSKTWTDTPTETIKSANVIDEFALQLDDSIDRFGVFGEETGKLFRSIGVQTINDLLDADHEAVSQQLDRTGISAGVVELWQTHLAFLVYVPGLTLDDAQLLTGAGITNLEQLAEYDVDELTGSVREYLESPRGVRHARLRTRDIRSCASRWIEGVSRSRDRWIRSTHVRRWRSRDLDRRPTRRTTANGSSRSKRQTSTTQSSHPAVVRKASPSKKRKLRFRLSRTSAVVDAPSIGPKTAKRLAKVGITTVADLLAAGAAETAEALDVKHISAETIVTWQHQAQLMCRIPELLARDTQMLVGSGFTTPEDIAAAEAADLLEFAKSYAATPEGSRALRGSDPPDLSRVTKWIDWAGHRRAMEAA